MVVNISFAVKKLLCPTKLQSARQYFKKKPLKVLDVGCGNRSCELTRYWLNVQEYVGVDREYWHGDQSGYERIDRMFFMDLDMDSALSSVEENYFDLIIFNHVIEHLRNGEKVLAGLYRKLRAGGMIYVETPNLVTLNYPSAIGFMNFYDEPTHIRIYPIQVLVAEMVGIGYKIRRFGQRRDWLRLMLFSPFMIIFNLVFSLPFKRRLDARGLWDLFGVASFVSAIKDRC